MRPRLSLERRAGHSTTSESSPPAGIRRTAGCHRRRARRARTGRPDRPADGRQRLQRHGGRRGHRPECHCHSHVDVPGASPAPTAWCRTTYGMIGHDRALELAAAALDFGLATAIERHCRSISTAARPVERSMSDAGRCASDRPASSSPPPTACVRASSTARGGGRRGWSPPGASRRGRPTPPPISRTPRPPGVRGPVRGRGVGGPYRRDAVLALGT